MRGYGVITPLKMSRKIWYLRRQDKPNQEDGATKRTWMRFFYVLSVLKLAQKLHYYY